MQSIQKSRGPIWPIITNKIKDEIRMGSNQKFVNFLTFFLDI